MVTFDGIVMQLQIKDYPCEKIVQDQSRSKRHIASNQALPALDTVKEEILVGEKFRTFPSKTFRMELNFVLSNWPKPEKLEKTIEKPVNHAEEILVWKLISYIFELNESYEIKFPTKISSFTVLPTRHVAIDDDCSGKGLAFTKNNWPADWLTWWGFPDSWGFPLVSAALLVYPVHCRS